MGGGGSKPVHVHGHGFSRAEQEAHTNASINQALQQDRLNEDSVYKLLLLGAGESGKSTVFKQLVHLYRKGYASEESRRPYAATIYDNALESMRRLVESAIAFGAAPRLVSAVPDLTTVTAPHSNNHNTTQRRSQPTNATAAAAAATASASSSSTAGSTTANHHSQHTLQSHRSNSQKAATATPVVPVSPVSEARPSVSELIVPPDPPKPSAAVSNSHSTPPPKATTTTDSPRHTNHTHHSAAATPASNHRSSANTLASASSSSPAAHVPAPVQAFTSTHAPHVAHSSDTTHTASSSSSSNHNSRRVLSRADSNTTQDSILTTRQFQLSMTEGDPGVPNTGGAADVELLDDIKQDRSFDVLDISGRPQSVIIQLHSKLSAAGQASAEYIMQLEKSAKPQTELAFHIKTLWAEPAIRECYDVRHLFQLADECPYLFERIDAIVQSNYVPSYDDILHVRARSTGIAETNFELEHNHFRLLDVGGQKNERKKWIHQFQGVTAVIFVVALSEYDQMLFEDGVTNRMHDALQLFENICALKWFQETSLMLFLNKMDLFKQKIARQDLNVCWPQYTGGCDYDKACLYIKQKFLSANKRSSRRIYTHVTCATDTSNVAFTFVAVKDIIIKRALKEYGLSL